MFRKIDADCYVLVDGDDTYPADKVKEMCAEVIDNGYDMVIGDRLSSTYFSENKRPFHNFGNVIVRWMVNFFWKKNNEHIYDVMTGYRVFSKLFVKSFPVLSKGFEIETEMTIHALDKNLYLKNIPIEYRDRPKGSESKLNTYSDGFKVILTIVKLIKEYKPLFFFNVLSLIFFVLSAVLFIPVFIEYIKTGMVPRYPSLIVSGIFLVISVQCLFSGFILDTIIAKDKKAFEIQLLRLTKEFNDAKK